MKLPNMRRYIGVVLLMINFDLHGFCFAQMFLFGLRAELGGSPAHFTFDSFLAYIILALLVLAISTALLFGAYVFATGKGSKPARRILSFTALFLAYLIFTSIGLFMISDVVVG
jgi:hypothetical protein